MSTRTQKDAEFFCIFAFCKQSRIYLESFFKLEIGNCVKLHFCFLFFYFTFFSQSLTVQHHYVQVEGPVPYFLLPCVLSPLLFLSEPPLWWKQPRQVAGFCCHTANCTLFGSGVHAVFSAPGPPRPDIFMGYRVWHPRLADRIFTCLPSRTVFILVVASCFLCSSVGTCPPPGLKPKSSGLISVS